MTNELINTKVDQINELKAQIEALEQKAEAIKNELKAELDQRKVDSVDTGLHRVFYSVYEKANVDTAKLKEEGLYDKFKKMQTIVSFKITDVKA